MKKLRLSLVAAMLMVITAVSAQTSLGIKGGLNMSNFYGDEVNDKNMKLGFHVGLVADYEFAPNMAIQSGLLFTTKGSEFKLGTENVKIEQTVNPMYLQVPVHFAYKADVMPGTRIVFHAGPYVAYGIAGKAKVKGTLGDSSAESRSVNVFGDKALLKPFDAGLGLGVGAEFSRFLVDIGWDMGLVNISKADNGNIKNQNAYLSVGYKF